MERSGPRPGNGWVDKRDEQAAKASSEGTGEGKREDGKNEGEAKDKDKEGEGGHKGGQGAGEEKGKPAEAYSPSKDGFSPGSPKESEEGGRPGAGGPGKAKSGLDGPGNMPAHDRRAPPQHWDHEFGSRGPPPPHYRDRDPRSPRRGEREPRGGYPPRSPRGGREHDYEYERFGRGPPRRRGPPSGGEPFGDHSQPPPRWGERRDYPPPPHRGPYRNRGPPEWRDGPQRGDRDRGRDRGHGQGHDHGRVEEKGVQVQDARKLCVSKIPEGLTGEDVERFIDSLGTVTEKVVKQLGAEGMHMGYAFFTMDTAEAARRILSQDRRHAIKGKPVQIGPANKGRSSCRNFNEGHCKYGNSCHFTHAGDGGAGDRGPGGGGRSGERVKRPRPEEWEHHQRPPPRY